MALAARADRLSYVLCDLFDPTWPQDVGGPFDLAVSAIVLHNLASRDKIFACYPAIHGLLKPGGCFLNYDRFVDGVEEHMIELRAAGFDPLAPPLREGTSYVVRAIDFRGVAMRVVVDARSGAIRDANRIVSGPGLYGPYAPGPYPPAPYGRFGPPRYLAPADEVAAYGRPPYIGASEVPSSDQDELRGLAPARSQYPAGTSLVPLPLPRPAGLAAAGGGETKSTVKPDIATGTPLAPGSVPLNNPTSASAIPAIND